MNNNNTQRLTQKQEAFCLNYLRLGNATESARLAGYKGNDVALAVNSSKMLRNNKVAGRIAELRKRAEDAAVADVVERKRVLTEIVRGRFADFVNPTPDKLKSAALQEIKVTATGEGVKRQKTTTIKLRDPISAIDLLNKMDKIYSDGAQVNNNFLIVKGYIGVSPDDWDQEKLTEG